jgi:ribosomal protein S18 acetylase RimI-like enzyme
MTLDDYDAMVTLWRATPGVGLSSADERPQIERFLQRNPGLCFTAHAAGQVVGTVLCGQDGRRAYLYHVAVTPAYRRQGIAQAMLQRTLDELARLGIGKCHLFVMADNALGQAFWQADGWQRRDDLLVFSKNPPNGG